MPVAELVVDHFLHQLNRVFDSAGNSVTHITVLATAIFVAKVVTARLHTQQLSSFGKLHPFGRAFMSL